MDSTTFNPSDGGCWAWVVCAASCWVNGTVFGIINSFGVILVAIVEDMEGVDAFKAAWVGSMCSGLTFMLSPLSSFLTDRIGCRVTGLIGGSIACVGFFLSSFVNRVELLYVTYGLAVGGGFSIAYTPSLVIIGHYFKKRIGLANGIVVTGSSIFTIILPFLIQFVLRKVGLKLTLRYLTSITLIMTLCALVFIPKLQKDIKQIAVQNGAKTKKKSVVHRKQSVFIKVNPFTNVTTGIWKNRNYVIWAIGVPLALFGYFVPFFHLINHIEHKFPEANAPLAIACLGATSGLGRLISGILSDHPRVNRVMMQQLSFLVIGVCTMLLPVCPNFASILVAVSLMGLFDGCFVCMIGPIAFDLVGPKMASQALGFVLGSMSIPMTIGPPVAGWIYDQTSSYTVAFILAGVSPVIGASFLMLIHRGKKMDTRPMPLAEEGELMDIGEVFDEDEKDDKAIGKLSKEPSVRRPSRKSEVTMNEIPHINEEYIRLSTTMGIKRTAPNGYKPIRVSLTNGSLLKEEGDICLHRTENGEISNGKLTNENKQITSKEKSLSPEKDKNEMFLHKLDMRETIL